MSSNTEIETDEDKYRKEKLAQAIHIKDFDAVLANLSDVDEIISSHDSGLSYDAPILGVICTKFSPEQVRTVLEAKGLEVKGLTIYTLLDERIENDEAVTDILNILFEYSDLENSSDEVNYLHDEHWVLGAAIDRKRPKSMVQLLLDHGAKVFLEKEVKYGDTIQQESGHALAIAAEHATSDIFELLYETGCNQGFTKETLLTQAVLDNVLKREKSEEQDTIIQFISMHGAHLRQAKSALDETPALSKAKSQTFFGQSSKRSSVSAQQDKDGPYKPPRGPK